MTTYELPTAARLHVEWIEELREARRKLKDDQRNIEADLAEVCGDISHAISAASIQRVLDEVENESTKELTADQLEEIRQEILREIG